MITETLMGSGSFEFRVKPGTAFSIRKAIPFVVNDGTYNLPWGHFVVTPQRLEQASPTRAQVLAAARFCGRISRRSDEMHTFGGEGVGIWLGDTNGGGPTVSSGTFTRTWQQWIHRAFLTPISGGISTDDPFLTEGAYFSPITTTYTSIFVNLQLRKFIDDVAAATGNVWRVNPDGTFDSGVPSSLFTQTSPTVLVTKGGAREITQSGGVGFNAIVTGLPATRLDADENTDEFVDSIEVDGQGVGVGQSDLILLAAKAFDGTTDNVWRGAPQTSQSSDNTTVGNQGSAYLAKWVPVQQKIRCSVDVFDIRRYCQPGDNIFVYNPDANLVSTMTPIAHRGAMIQPVKVPLQGFTWPVEKPMGAYVIVTQDGSNRVIDISDQFAYESGTTELVIGDRALTITEIVTKNRRFT